MDVKRLFQLRIFGQDSEVEWLRNLQNHSGVGLWDAILYRGDPMHPKARWTWSPEFRRLCGFSSEHDFPNVVQSWSDRLHPDDAQPTFDIFGNALSTGKLYDTTYRLKVADGSYRWFRATGGVVLDRNGRARRASGSLVDIHESREMQGEQDRAVSLLGTAMHQLALGDLRTQLGDDFPLSLDVLKGDFNTTIRQLREVISLVTGSAQSVQTGSNEIRSASEDLARRTEQQAANLQETTASMSQVTDMMAGTASGIVEVRGAINATHEDASEGGKVVHSAVTAMAEIEKSSLEIGNIINVIDGIAFQTNLLALNAGVEAARAGDAGKGFAVVANEVRALAQRSAEAAKDIKALITTSTQQVSRGVNLVGETGQMLDRMLVKIAEVNGLIADIAKSTEMQSGNLRAVNSAVTDMDRLTQQNAAMVEEATAASRSLASEANELSSLVARFHLSDEPTYSSNSNFSNHEERNVRPLVRRRA